MLRWSLNGLAAQLDQGGFGPRPTAIKPILTTAKNDVSSMSWVDDVPCRVTRECDLGKDAVYASYAAFCDKSNLTLLSLVTFWTRVVQVLPGLQIRKKRINGAETRVCNIQPAPADGGGLGVDARLSRTGQFLPSVSSVLPPRAALTKSECRARQSTWQTRRCAQSDESHLVVRPRRPGVSATPA